MKRSLNSSTAGILLPAVLIGLAKFSSVAEAAGQNNWRDTDRPACELHNHGDYWHDCQDRKHALYNVSHNHRGLVRYHIDRGSGSGSGFTSAFYLGLKSGTLRSSDSNFADAGYPKGVTLGFGIAQHTIEIEAISTLVQSSDTNGLSNLSGRDSSLISTGVYSVRRLGDYNFTKIKLGILHTRLDSPTEREQNFSVSGGLGLGLTFGNIVLEAEYTWLNTDTKLLSLGFNMSF